MLQEERRIRERCFTEDAMSSSTPHVVELDPDHPGFRDEDYRRRRDLIAQIALEHRFGEDIPEAPYTKQEHAVWALVWAQLPELFSEHVAAPVLAMQDRFPFDTSVIPQLREVNQRLKDATGYSMEPVAGLVAAKDFLQALGDGYFCSTQYIRHASRPLYTPEPDIIHELVGHAALLSDPRMAGLQRLLGSPVRDASPSEVDRLIRIYWYTIEFGVLWENGEVKAYGAGLLSSAGELAQINDGPELREWNLREMATTPYDPTYFQGILWVAPSWERVFSDLEAWISQGLWRDEHYQ